MEEIIQALEAAFFEHGQGRVEMPPKPGVHTMPDAFIHAMPAYIPILRSAGVKWVSGYPENSRRGLPYISGLLVLNDVETGLPLAVMDCTWITAMRTGAATALAAKYLARKNCRTLAILGCGVQARSNLEALSLLFPLEKVFVFDVAAAAMDTFACEAQRKFALDVVKAQDARQAVVAADIVVTAGPILKKPHATIQSGWLQAGSFASLIDFDSYFSGQALREVDKFCTDDIPQLEHYRQIGYFQDIPPVYASLGELVAGIKPGRTSQQEKTIACNLGLALDDIATAPIVYRRALEAGVGTMLPL